jgi:hypothetical protein
MKRIKILLTIIASLIIGYYSWSLFIIVKNRHHVDMSDYSPYMWIFKDSIKNDVDTDMFISYTKERDLYYDYVLKSGYFVSIWEFKDLGQIKLSDVPIHRDVSLSDVEILSKEVLNSKDIPSIITELGFKFVGSIGLNIDDQSKIIKQLDTPNYKGFYGMVNKLSLSNEKGKHLIIFDYSRKNKPTLFLFYKTTKSFYVILINSRNVPFDESIIKLLNLS